MPRRVARTDLRGPRCSNASGLPGSDHALNLAYKDLHLALELGDELNVPLPQGSSTHNLQRLARGMGLGPKDSSAILRVYETALGRTIKP